MLQGITVNDWQQQEEKKKFSWFLIFKSICYKYKALGAFVFDEVHTDCKARWLDLNCFELLFHFRSCLMHTLTNESDPRLWRLHRYKGSHSLRKVQFFWTVFKRPLTPPPFIWTFVLFCRGCFLNVFLSIWYNVPISPPNFTINASKVPFHANFMLLNDLQNTRQFPT